MSSVRNLRTESFYTFLLVIVYAGIFYGLQFLLHAINVANLIPTEQNLNSWDATWYRAIATEGYKFNPAAQSNTGFYFLFPALLKITHIGVWGSCILNVFLFAIGFSFLTALFRLSVTDKLLWLSVPTVFFTFVPYSEALFFLLSTLSVWSISKGNKPMLWVSLFLLSLTRATAIPLVPALFIMELLGNERMDWLSSIKVCIANCVIPVLAGLAVFVIIQYHATGVWFAYFIQQSAFWGRQYTRPEFPLTNAFGPSVLWLGALTVFACLLAFGLLVRLAKNWYKENKPQDKVLVLSLGYLTMILYTILFFNTPTQVSGLFRYALVSPFFYVFLKHFTKSVRYERKDFYILLLFANCVWLLFGSFRHVQTMVYFNLNTIVILLYMSYANKKPWWPLLVLLAFNIFFQVHFFQQFIANTILVD
jgi:hypothetical protein